MALKTNKFAAATAVAAAFSLLAPPAAAVDLPKPVAARAYDGDALNAERHRRWRRDRNDIDTGDVVAGVLVIGAIAAIAGAARNRDRDRYERRYPYPNEDYGYRGAERFDRPDSRGIGRAVDMCMGEVERGRDRVGSVDSATRSADGWHVSGALESGAGYACTIGNDGRIVDVRLGSYGYGTGPEAADGGQYDDDYYSRARETQRSAEPYPDDDGRYETARAPDFAQ